MKYTKPKLVPLSDWKLAKGAKCQYGSVPTSINCKTGGLADSNCRAGTTAGARCRPGNVAVTRCRAGSVIV